jgi:hypothetical protein
MIVKPLEIDGDVARNHTITQENDEIDRNLSVTRDYVVVRRSGEVITITAGSPSDRAKKLKNDHGIDEVKEQYAYGYLKDGLPMIAGGAPELFGQVQALLIERSSAYRKKEPATS